MKSVRVGVVKASEFLRWSKKSPEEILAAAAEREARANSLFEEARRLRAFAALRSGSDEKRIGGVRK